MFTKISFSLWTQYEYRTKEQKGKSSKKQKKKKKDKDSDAEDETTTAGGLQPEIIENIKEHDTADDVVQDLHGENDSVESGENNKVDNSADYKEYVWVVWTPVLVFMFSFNFSGQIPFRKVNRKDQDRRPAKILKWLIQQKLTHHKDIHIKKYMKKIVL